MKSIEKNIGSLYQFSTNLGTLIFHLEKEYTTSTPKDNISLS